MANGENNGGMRHNKPPDIQTDAWPGAHSQVVPATPDDETKPAIKESDVQGVKYLRDFMELLKPLHAHRDNSRRKLHYDEYCAYLLLCFFTPIIDSIRGLQKVSEFDKIRDKLKLPRFSLGSFSEAGHVFDPEVLVPIIEQICGQLSDIEQDPRLRNLDKRPTLVDGTLLRALPKMVWALWLDEEHHAAKMHLQYDLLKGAPNHATLTDGQGSEVAELRARLCPGKLYVDDRGYFSYLLMAAILQVGSSFVTRVKDNISYEIIEERKITPEDAKLGIEKDLIVRVGSKPNQDKIDRPLRLVQIYVPEAPPLPGQRPSKLLDSKTKQYRTRSKDHTLLLLTDLLDLDVSLIALLFKYRWQIELFFRWFKIILQADKILSQCKNGMTIAMYCALIASLLVVLWTGRKPTKRTFELICFYFAGWVSEQEMIQRLNKLQEAAQKQKTGEKQTSEVH